MTTAANADTDAAVDALTGMLRIRRFEERALALQREGKIYGVVHPYIGQEAVAVGVCGALRPSDFVMSNHRNHGHCLAHGADPNRMMAELLGRSNGYCGGKGGSMHLVDIERGILGADGIVGANGPYAVGSALASLYRGDDAVTVCFTSDGATGQGAIHEALNLSALWDAPMVWVCENNQYASGTPRAENFAATSIAQLGGSYGIPSYVVDGTSIAEVSAVATEAVARARRGEGPSFIEARVYRFMPHAVRGTAGVQDSRPAAELARWRARDPITLLYTELVETGRIDEATFAAIDAEVAATLDAAVAFAEAGPHPDLAGVHEGVFA